MQKPRKLQPGDRVAAVTLSWGGPGAIPGRYQAGKQQFEQEFSVEVVETPHAFHSPDWLARNPKARAEDLMGAFADPSIKAIISAIGGEDSVRILPYLDLAVIRSNPKIFMGYSDTTVSHFACFKAGLTSFYGPSFMAGFAENGGMFPYMVESVRKTLFSSEAVGVVAPNPTGWTVDILDWSDPANQSRRRKLNPSSGWNFLRGAGTASGQLIGGCIEALEFLKGTEWWPGHEAWQGALLFLETSEEGPSLTVFKRWLRNYGSQGILQRLSGILLGRPGGQIPESAFAGYDQATLAVLDELDLQSLPVVTGMDFGHTDPMFVLPYGVPAAIDCEQRTFSILENAVL
jgi:muramoyltetrapeptide carboxypeptidase LdcA involved in peptidoglycan recycling